MRIEPFCDATVSTFKVLVGYDLQPCGAQCSEPGQDIHALVSFQTECGIEGTLALGVSREFARRCSHDMFGVADDASVHDLTGEIANTVAGLGLANSNVVSRMSVPSVVAGESCRVYPWGKVEGESQQTLSCEHDKVLLQVFYRHVAKGSE